MIELLRLTDFRQFQYLIDSERIRDARTWEFKHLPEGDYAIAFLFESNTLPNGSCIRINTFQHSLEISAGNSRLDLGQMQLEPCPDSRGQNIR